MAQKCCTAQFVATGRAAALALGLAVSGCGTVEVFGQYDLPEGPEVATAPYPRLVDTPDAPAQGSYSAAVPDPAQGARNQADLSAAAVFAEAEAERLSAPVISAAEKARMLAAARRNRQ